MRILLLALVELAATTIVAAPSLAEECGRTTLRDTAVELCMWEAEVLLERHAKAGKDVVDAGELATSFGGESEVAAQELRATRESLATCSNQAGLSERVPSATRRVVNDILGGRERLDPAGVGINCMNRLRRWESWLFNSRRPTL